MFYDFIYKYLSNLILCGDFNINLLDKLDSRAFFNILNQLGLMSKHTDTLTCRLLLTHAIPTHIDSVVNNYLFIQKSVSGIL